jgi:acid phosphatase class B
MPSQQTIVMSSTGKREEAAEATPEKFDAETPLTIIGLAAIAMILLINSPARPTAAAPAPHFAAACDNCGTVTAVRRSAHSAPVYFVEVQMLDGSVRTIQQLAAGFNVGDIVQVNGNALTLRTAKAS